MLPCVQCPGRSRSGEHDGATRIHRQGPADCLCVRREAPQSPGSGGISALEGRREEPPVSKEASHLFLLEIGCEELPHWAIAPALNHLRKEFAALAVRERLNEPIYEPEDLLGTPRRLALLAGNLLARQADREVEVLGPRVDAAFDPGGKPTRAVEGFARAQGVPVAELVRVSTPRGSCMAARRREKGKEAREVLASALPALIASIPFGKTMRWGEGEFRFARPLRWILCLWGGEVVPFEVGGVRSGRTTLGARFEGSSAVEIPDARAFLDRLRKISVMV